MYMNHERVSVDGQIGTMRHGYIPHPRLDGGEVQVFQPEVEFRLAVEEVGYFGADPATYAE
jgi:hypothetical protein